MQEELHSSHALARSGPPTSSASALQEKAKAKSTGAERPFASRQLTNGMTAEPNNGNDHDKFMDKRCINKQNGMEMKSTCTSSLITPPPFPNGTQACAQSQTKYEKGAGEVGFLRLCSLLTSKIRGFRWCWIRCSGMPGWGTDFHRPAMVLCLSLSVRHKHSAPAHWANLVQG